MSIGSNLEHSVCEHLLFVDKIQRIKTKRLLIEAAGLVHVG